jgi:hypothetical protein
MTPAEDPTGERTFLHDLSNIVAVAQGNLHLILLKAKKNPGEMKVEDVLAKVEQSLTSMNKMVEFLNARREVVRNSANQRQKEAS